MKTFQDVIAWQEAYRLTLEIYRLTTGFPSNEEFGLKSQLRRSAVSVISNIAEGFKRKSKRDKLRFYNQAEASLEELKCQTMLSKDLGYITANLHFSIRRLENSSGRLLHKWICSTDSTYITK